MLPVRVLHTNNHTHTHTLTRILSLAQKNWPQTPRKRRANMSIFEGLAATFSSVVLAVGSLGTSLGASATSARASSTSRAAPKRRHEIVDEDDDARAAQRGKKACVATEYETSVTRKLPGENSKSIAAAIAARENISERTVRRWVEQTSQAWQRSSQVAQRSSAEVQRRAREGNSRSEQGVRWSCCVARVAEVLKEKCFRIEDRCRTCRALSRVVHYFGHDAAVNRIFADSTLFWLRRAC